MAVEDRVDCRGDRLRRNDTRYDRVGRRGLLLCGLPIATKKHSQVGAIDVAVVIQIARESRRDCSKKARLKDRQVTQADNKIAVDISLDRSSDTEVESG